ncbi:MAG TPA: nucleoside recognition domain-containing protein [Selenomonadales bacterium]|nr:nucleoside recognition domain-containing protein [Selenomonadales bacterium]
MKQETNPAVGQDNTPVEQKNEIDIMSYINPFLAIIILSGALAGTQGWLKAFDFNSLTGDFGTMKNAAQTFVGSGGTGAKQGFLFGLGLIPAVMLSVGIMSIVEQTGGMKVAQKVLTPILRPLMGLPGCASLALIASTQSTDAGASLTRVMFEKGELNGKERLIFTTYENSGAAAIGNFISIGAAAFPYIVVAMGIPFAVILIMKFIGANIARLILNKFYKEEELAN